MTAQRVIFNGRFLSQIQTGVQRYARETLLALDHLLGEDVVLRARLHCTLAVPQRALAAAQALKLRRIDVHAIPWLAGHLWEQIALPLYAGASYVVNFNYSAPLLKRRQLITVHDASVHAVPDAYSRRYRWLHEALVRILKNRVDTVMTVSRFSQTELAHHCGIDPALIGIEGWQHSVASGDSAATLRKYGLAPGQYLLAVGSVKPHKNFAILDRALELLGDYPLPVAVAGSRDIGIFRHHRQAQKNARMLGFVSDSELFHLYRHAAWFVFPSTYEGFGLPALEAMANGCPVLAARAAAIPEVCGAAALYFDPLDPESLASLLRRVLVEPSLRTALLAKAQERLRLYSWAGNARIIARRLFVAAAQPSVRSARNTTGRELKH
jgi:glycosyltransferase involved in cell wall biosynthesis